MTLEEFQLSAADDIDKQTRRFNRELTRHYAAARDAIQAELEKLYSRVLDGVDPERYYAEMVKYERLSKLQGQVKAAYYEAARKAGVEVERASRLAMSNNFYATQYAVNTAAYNVNGARIGFNALPKQLIEVAVAGTPEAYKAITDAIRDRYGDGYQPTRGTLSELLVNRRNADLKRVNDVVTQAMIQGKSVSNATRDLTRAVAIGRNNAERIIRTESHRTRSLGHYAAHNNAKAEGVETRRQIVSVLDDRTRAQSAQVDGQFEDENGYFTYPGGVKVAVPGNSGVPAWDIRDRERVIDVVDGWEPETRRARNPATGENEIIGMKSFQNWADEVGLTRNRYGELVA